MLGDKQHKEYSKLLQKAFIAIAIWCIIIFSNIENINQPLPIEEENNNIPEQHYVSSGGEDIVIQDLSQQIMQKIKISNNRNIGEQEVIKNKALEVILNMNNSLQSKTSLIDSIDTITINKEKSTSRGYSSHNSIVINYGTMNSEEFQQVMAHELGHIIDLGTLKGSSIKKDESFSEFKEFIFAEDDPSLSYYAFSRESEEKKREGSTKKDFCSVYGMTNPFEDFAECINLYLYHHSYFSILSENNNKVKKKYNYITNLFGSYYITEGKIPENKGLDYRYWDTTKIP